METRHQKKRRWQSSPGKKARVELDFGQNTPSPKRVRLGTPVVPSKTDYTDSDSFTIRSFYGKKEKTSFPHSPGRRKAVDKVLDKISDENTDSENEKLDRKRQTFKKHISDVEMFNFDFQSSDSTETENEDQRRPVLRQKNVDQNGGKKVPLKIVTSKRTPKYNSKEKVFAKSTGKIASKSKEMKEQEMTPVHSGRKFFKTRSPASSDKALGNLVIKKGFELKFYPKRLNLSKKMKGEKSESKSASKKAKTKLVNKVKVSDAKVFDSNTVFFVDEDHEQEDRAELHDSQLEITSDISGKDFHENNLVKESAIEKSDSGIETTDSTDLFSSQSDSVNYNNTKKTEGGVQDEDSENNKENNIEKMSETVSLIGAGSDDLFSHSGRSTPQNVHSGEVTPLEQTPVQGNQGSPSGSSTHSADGTGTSKPLKLFPLFTKKSPATTGQLGKLRGKSSPSETKSPAGSTKNSPLLRYVKSKDNLEQMIIDAGQKRYGATQCQICGMVYAMSEPADETTHSKFHTSLLNALKFPGWKKEHVVQEYMDTGSRVLMITAESPKYALRKMEEINKIMGQELGFPEANLLTLRTYKTFLYVSENKKIEGCCVTEPVSEGFRVLPDTKASQSSQNHPGHRPWCCSDKPEPALVGVSRIWVYSQARRKGVATRLLDCVRQWSVYGTLVPKLKLAFSDPTPDGKLLACRYTGTPNFLVYKYH